MVDQAEIKRDAEEARDGIARARGEVEIAVARLRAVQMRCSHPDQYQTSHMGETSMYCPDCGRDR